MTKYRFWQGPVLALFSKPFYASVARDWKGIAMGYLLFLLAICWIPGVMKINRIVTNFEKREMSHVLEQIPPLEIKDGKLLSSAKLPYTIALRDGEKFIRIDKDATVADYEKYDVPVLITENEIIAQKSKAEKRIYSFKDMPDLSIDAQFLTEVTNKALSLFKLLFYPLAVLNSFTTRLLQAVIYALLGLIIASVLNRNISFAAVFRLAVVAMTAGIIYRTIVFYLGLQLPYYWLTGVVLTLIFLFIGLSAAENEEAEIDYSDIEADPY